MGMIIKGIAYPMIGLLIAAFIALLWIYAIDAIHEIFVNGTVWLIFVGMFAGSLLILVIYWAVLLALVPLSVASSDDASAKAKLLGVGLAPLGFVVGFLLWQIENALIYGLLGVEPWLYNKIFDLVSLGV